MLLNLMTIITIHLTFRLPAIHTSLPMSYELDELKILKKLHHQSNF